MYMAEDVSKYLLLWFLFKRSSCIGAAVSSFSFVYRVADLRGYVFCVSVCVWVVRLQRLV